MLFFRFKNLVMLRSHYKDNINNMGDMLVVKISEKCKISLKNKRILYKRALWGRRLGGRHVVRLLSCVWLFATPWAAAGQAFLSSTISWSLPKLLSIESVMPSNHPILCRPLILLPSIFPSIRVFSNESAFRIRLIKVLELQFQHQSFQWIVTDFL